MKVYLSRPLIFLIPLLILSFTSCQSEEKDDCEAISMKCYQGWPRKCNELKKQCSGKKIKYTAKLCQKAFNELLLGREYKQILNVYGDRIEGCFSQSEIKKYKK